MKSTEQIKESLKEILNSTTDVETIKKIGSLENKLDEVESEYKTLEQERDDLKKDYLDLYKASAFKSDFKPKEVVEDFSFDSFIKNYNFK